MCAIGLTDCCRIETRAGAALAPRPARASPSAMSQRPNSHDSREVSRAVDGAHATDLGCRSREIGIGHVGTRPVRSTSDLSRNKRRTRNGYALRLDPDRRSGLSDRTRGATYRSHLSSPPTPHAERARLNAIHLLAHIHTRISASERDIRPAQSRMDGTRESRPLSALSAKRAVRWAPRHRRALALARRRPAQ